MKLSNRVAIAFFLFVAIFALAKLYVKPSSEEVQVEEAVEEKPVAVESVEIVEKSDTNGMKGVLYIIEGKEVESVANISPDRIASMEVLKGQSAIDKYGEKGKNGVIVITLKK